jgi:hypothetical protein
MTLLPVSNTESIPVARSDNDWEEMAAYTISSVQKGIKRSVVWFWTHFV